MIHYRAIVFETVVAVLIPIPFLPPYLSAILLALLFQIVFPEIFDRVTNSGAESVLEILFFCNSDKDFKELESDHSPIGFSGVTLFCARKRSYELEIQVLGFNKRLL